MKKILGLLVAGLTLTVAAPVVLSQGPVRDRLHNLLFRDSGASSCGASASGSCATASTACAPATVMTTAPAASKAAVMAKGTIIHEIVRHRLAAALVKKGYSVTDARNTANSVSNELIEAAAEQVGAPGGFFRQLLTAFIQFLQSPQGQQLMAALIQMLLSLLGGG